MSAHTDKRVKARKRHTCLWCGEKVLAGETYMRSSGISDDGGYSYAMHQECFDAMEAADSETTYEWFDNAHYYTMVRGTSINEDDL